MRSKFYQKDTVLLRNFLPQMDFYVHYEEILMYTYSFISYVFKNKDKNRLHTAALGEFH